MITDKLYINFNKFKKPRTAKKFLYLYFKHSRPATYLDKDCTLKHCSRGKQRSFEDLYNLCKTYYPYLSLKRFGSIVGNLCKNRIIVGRYCGDVRKIVFMAGSAYLGYNDHKYPFVNKITKTRYDKLYLDYYPIPHNNYEKIRDCGFNDNTFTLDQLKKLIKW